MISIFDIFILLRFCTQLFIIIENLYYFFFWTWKGLQSDDYMENKELKKQIKASKLSKESNHCCCWTRKASNQNDYIENKEVIKKVRN
jgi:hypothetical protein